ncbi:MAG: sulfotransferase family protein [Actinomycetota bacterium]
MPWTPPPRGAWVDKLAVTGQSLGDDGRSIISLSPEELLGAAEETTGLSDWGDDWFRAPLGVLTESLETEARLHLPGRLRARSELQRILQGRLQLVDLWARQPDVLDNDVEAPVFVTGLGRSGTTLLHELLALDPGARSPALWEFAHPVPPPEAATAETDPRITIADDEITVMDEMFPAFTGMHENRGFLPTECIFAFAFQCSTDMFTGLYDVPSYTMYRAGGDRTPEYAWHRRLLATLGSRRPGSWVLKAPSHLSALPTLFAEYPDARVVITHRDPLRVVGSLTDMMATLRWMHSDHVDHAAISELLGMGLVFQMDTVSAARDSGAVPEDRVHDVLYSDLIADPVATVESLYADWDREFTNAFRARLQDYVDARHRGHTSGHDYSFADTGLDQHALREQLRSYQERYGVVSEV